MAYILSISDKSKSETFVLNQIVSIQDQKPSKHEYDIFNVIEVSENAPKVKSDNAVAWDEIKAEPSEKLMLVSNKISKISAVSIG